LAKGANSSGKRKWEKRIDGIIKQHEDILESNMKIMFSLVWGQCSDSVHAKMEAQTNFTRISTTSDSLALLKLLKQDAYNFQAKSIRYMQNTRQGRSSFTSYKSRTVTTSPSLTISTTV